MPKCKIGSRILDIVNRGNVAKVTYPKSDLTGLNGTDLIDFINDLSKRSDIDVKFYRVGDDGFWMIEGVRCNQCLK